MKALFWVSVGLLAYAYIGYPCLLWVLGWLRGRTWRQEDILPGVTLIIPAYNEQSVIGQKLENSLSLDYPAEKLEIVVASESTDQTNAVVARYAARGVRLLASAGRQGKAALLYKAVPGAKGEIVAFTDATAKLDPQALRKLVRSFADPRVGCVSCLMVYETDRLTRLADTHLLYWNFEMQVRMLESRLCSLLGASGWFFALRKELYAPLDETRGDDFELAVRVLLQGFGAVLEPEALAREKLHSAEGAEFRRRIRNVSAYSGSALRLFGETLRKPNLLVAWQLLSHKFLRWLAPVFLLVLLAGAWASHGLFYRAALAAQLAFYLLAAVGWLLDVLKFPPSRPFSIPYHFCVIHLAMLLALVGLPFSRPSPTWEPLRDG